MYEKFLIIASKKDSAGMNIANQLAQFRKNPILSGIKKNSRGFDFYFAEDEIVFAKNLDLKRIGDYDFVIFASKHSSAKNEKAFTIHAPGNWRNADFGGESGKVCRSSALFQKQFFEKLNKNIKEHEIKDYALTMEATHHGPLIDKPCLFAEIGSTDSEYTDRRAGFVMAKTISEMIEEFKPNPYNEIAIAVGGPHYCPNFNKIQSNSNVAISHVISKNAFPLTREMIEEAIQKTEEEVDFILLDWKGLGNKEMREQVTEALKDFHLQAKKTGEILK